MTDDLTKLEAIASQASEGPWIAEPLRPGGYTVFTPASDEGVIEDRYLGRANAAFIAAARDAVPALIARVRKAEAERACPVDCDTDCDSPCHASHIPAHKRDQIAHIASLLAERDKAEADAAEAWQRVSEHSDAITTWQEAAAEIELERDEARAALALAVEAVKSRREAFLSSPDLDPAWVAGWHAASDDALHSIRAALAGGDDRG